MLQAVVRLQASWKVSFWLVADTDPFFKVLTQAIQCHYTSESPAIKRQCADIVASLRELDPSHWAFDTFQVKVQTILAG